MKTIILDGKTYELRDATEEELHAQRTSWLIGEAGFGSDKDEADYRKALENDDKETITRLDNEAKARIQRTLEYAKNHLTVIGNL